jgi:hypothetical protein
VPNLDVAIRGKNAGLRESLNQAKSDVNAFKADVGKGGGLGGEIKQLVGTYLGLNALKGVIDYGDKIADLSQRFAISSDSLQRWGNVAEKNGSSIEGVAGAMNKLEIARDKALSGDGEMIAHFKELGVTVDDLKSKSPDDLLMAIGGSSMHAADMVAVLGRNALELVPTLETVADGSTSFGSIMSAGMVQVLGEASDKIKELTQTLRVGLGSALLFVSDIMERVGAVIAMYVNAIKGMSQEDYTNILAEQLNELEAKQAARNEPSQPDQRKRRDFEEPEKKGGGKSGADESIRLAERLADLQEKRAAKERSDREQIETLQTRQLDLEERITSAEEGSAEQLNLKVEAEENAAEIAERQRKIEEAEIDAMKRSAELRERIQTLHEQTAEIRAKTAFEALSTDEKIAELQKQIEKNTSDATDADAERTAELGKQRAELDDQLTSLKKLKAEEDKRAMDKKVDRKLMTPAERRDADREEARRNRAERAIRKNEANAEATKRKNGEFVGPHAPDVAKPDANKPADFKGALAGTEGKLSSIEGILDNRLAFPKLGGAS